MFDTSQFTILLQVSGTKLKDKSDDPSQYKLLKPHTAPRIFL